MEKKIDKRSKEYKESQKKIVKSGMIFKMENAPSEPFEKSITVTLKYLQSQIDKLNTKVLALEIKVG